MTSAARRSPAFSTARSTVFAALLPALQLTMYANEMQRIAMNRPRDNPSFFDGPGAAAPAAAGAAQAPASLDYRLVAVRCPACWALPTPPPIARAAAPARFC